MGYDSGVESDLDLGLVTPKGDPPPILDTPSTNKLKFSNPLLARYSNKFLQYSKLISVNHGLNLASRFFTLMPCKNASEQELEFQQQSWTTWMWECSLSLWQAKAITPVLRGL